MKKNSIRWVVLIVAAVIAAGSSALIYRSGAGANVGCGGSAELSGADDDAGVSSGSEELVWNQALYEQDFNGDGQADIAFHRPQSTWASLPVLMSNGNGTWSSANRAAPQWAHEPGVRAVSGDYNGDRRTDIALYRPASSWSDVPLLLADGTGGWTPHRNPAPSWANQPGVIALPGDFNGDRRADLAFHRPGGPWNTVPVLSSNGNGTWSSSNQAAPSWANQLGVRAVVGDFDGDSLSDIAFHRTGGSWNSVPVLLSNGDGSWAPFNMVVPSWANEPGAVALAGDFNGDRRADLAFHNPGSNWTSVPVLYGDGNGGWSARQTSAPSWANQPGTIAVVGDFNVDYRTDIAFYRPGGPWDTIPVLFGATSGGWTSSNYSAPAWANQPNVIALSGDYNRDYATDIAFYRPGGGWNTIPLLLSNRNGAWTAHNQAAPSWAQQQGVIAITRNPPAAEESVAVHVAGLDCNRISGLLPTGLSFRNIVGGNAAPEIPSLRHDAPIQIWEDEHPLTGFLFRLILMPETRIGTLRTGDTPYQLQQREQAGWRTIDSGLWGDRIPYCDPRVIRRNEVHLRSGAQPGRGPVVQPSETARYVSFMWDADTGEFTGGLSAWNAGAILMEIPEIRQRAPQSASVLVSLEYAGDLSWERFQAGNF